MKEKLQIQTPSRLDMCSLLSKKTYVQALWKALLCDYSWKTGTILPLRDGKTK